MTRKDQDKDINLAFLACVIKRAPSIMIEAGLGSDQTPFSPNDHVKDQSSEHDDLP